MQWFLKAAENGNANAQLEIGSAYAKGDGVLKDPVEAHAWCNIAGVRGEEKAQKARDSLEEKMTKEQIAEATKRARELMRGIQI